MTSSWSENLRIWAAALKTEIHALAIAIRDPRTPVLARLCAIIVVAYALSPIDLIPDFIPILGSLDDILLLPLGIALTIKLVPAIVMSEARLKASQSTDKKLGKAGALVIGLLWLLTLAAAAWWAAHRFFPQLIRIW